MGAINIDNTGSGGGITLSSDGTSLLLGGTAIGGGSPDLYADNYDGSSTKPSATGTNGVAIGRSASATSSDAFAFGFGAIATHGQSLALGTSRAFAGDAVAIHIDNNSTSYGASGANSIAIGYRAKASTSGGIAIGYLAVADGGGTGIALGDNARAGNNAISIGQDGWAGGQTYAQGQGSIAIGQNCLATQTASVVVGMHAYSNIIGKYVYSNGTWGQGTAQTGTFTLLHSTTDATPIVLTTNKSTASSNNQIILPNNSAYAFHGTIVARQQASGGTACAAWKIEGLIRREGTAGTTTLVNSATTVLDNTPSWGMALSADTTNGGLAITVTGAASTNIRWVATIHTSEVTYA